MATGRVRVVLSDVDTAAGASVTFLDARGATILDVAVPAGRTLSFVGVRFRDGERVAEVQVRSGAVPIAPGVVDSPQTDIAAIDDVIFGEPRGSTSSPRPTSSAATCRRESSASRRCDDAGRARLADPACEGGSSRAHAQGRARHLGRHRRPSSTLGKTARTLPLEAGATDVSFKVPGQGQARQAEAQARRSPTPTGDTASRRA